ncbi:phage infection protein [Corynebacterium kutscheri]|uniref:Phage infection protein n=1 Tax=Corynebacterium kutscheri TaxID=35755 RepID=A0AB38VU55_9CORY|nr:YhgE/Pip domain-containing protein [Corynebacterium kutscheri]VEH06953.1 phage infection protein [Corynebacterium kutscheri]VEH79448.1 phage infection protein [Corynebacterium kutscheri]
MRTSLTIFRRDFLRLLRTIRVWVIVIGVMLIPALYSWVNISAFWDPYSNTENIRVAVVNEDTGARSTITGPLNIGGQLVQQLHDDHQLGWQFMSASQAEEAVRSGDVFASIRIPEDFSHDFISMFQGTYSQPTLIYEVNEKLNAVAPKITDQGASGLDNAISTAFKKQIATAVSTQLKNSGGTLSKKFRESSTHSADAFNNAASTVDSASTQITELQNSISALRPTVEQAHATLDAVERTLIDAANTLTQVQKLSDDVNNEILNFSGDITHAYVDATTALTQATTNAQTTVTNINSHIANATNQINASTQGLHVLLENSDNTLTQLNSALSNPALPAEITSPLRQTLSDLQAQNAAQKAALNELETARNTTSDTSSSLLQAAENFAQIGQQGTTATQELRDLVHANVPRLTSGLQQVNATAGALSASLSAQQVLVSQAKQLLSGMTEQFSQTNNVLESFKNNLSGIQQGLLTARSDILALYRTIEGDEALNTISSLNTMEVSTFLATPTQLETHAIFPVSNYGSGMASLFSNLSLWIGAFMLLVIFRTEVDPAGLKNLTISSAYLGRFLLLAVFAIGQAIIVSTGNLIIGIDSVNPVVYIATTIIISLCYLSIVFGLVSTFGHIGRGLAVVLVFIQIPGSSGLYPIEMTPQFFQVISPLLPFTYGISAMRETVGGFYGHHYLHSLSVLTIMAIIAFLSCIILRRLLSHVNMLINEELAAGGLIVNEPVRILGSKYKVTDLIYVLKDREGFQESTANKWRWARRNYGLFIRLSIASGLATVVILGVLSRIYPNEKVIFFALACLSTLIVVTIICGLEYIKQSINRDQRLSELSAEELEQQLSEHSKNPRKYIVEQAPLNTAHVVIKEEENS